MSAAFLFVVYSGLNADSLLNLFANNNSVSSSTVITSEIAAEYGDASGIADGDTVSRATYSSMGIKEGVANALINAGGKNVEAIVNDLPEAGKQKTWKKKNF